MLIIGQRVRSRLISFARQAATDIFYFQELDRQAELAATSIYFAIMRGRETDDPRNTKVWGGLQNALFASICIARLLKAGNVKDDYPGMSQNQTKKFARKRGDRLRAALGIEDDSFIFEVEKVRNALACACSSRRAGFCTSRMRSCTSSSWKWN